MSDERLRTLERQFRESGAVDDEAAWLQARYNAGEISEDQLAIAGYCGNITARTMVDEPPGDIGFCHWVRMIPTISRNRALATRVDIAALAAILPVYETEFPGKLAPRIALMTTIRYVLYPTEVHRRACMASSFRLSRYDSDFPSEREIATFNAARNCAAEASYPPTTDRDGCLGTVLLAIKVGVASAVMRSICLSIIPWALGYKDPLIDLLAGLHPDQGD